MQDVPVSRIVKWSAFVVLLGVSVILLFLIFKNISDMQETISAREQTLQELQTELESASAETESVEKQTEVVKASIKSAKEVGDEIASLENDYMALVYKDRDSREEEDQDYALMNDICVKMDEYFGKDTFLRSIWYGGDMTQLPGAKWQFQTNYNYTGNQIPVLWILSTEGDGVLAYVTAVYDSESNTFDDYAKHTTVVGNSYLPYTENPSPLYDLDENFDSEEYMDSIFNIMQSVSENKAYMKNREESISWNQENADALEENAQARQQLIEAQENGGE